MISAGEFRNGVTFEQDGQVLQVVEFQHVKPGKGAAFGVFPSFHKRFPLHVFRNNPMC